MSDWAKFYTQLIALLVIGVEAAKFETINSFYMARLPYYTFILHLN